MSTRSHLGQRAPLATIVVVLLAIAGAGTSYAQITAASISGTVKDQTGGVLPGVDVVAKNLDTGLTRSAITNDQGLFTVTGLPPGRYEVRAALQGFSTAVQSGIMLAVAEEAGLNMTLSVGAT